MSGREVRLIVSVSTVSILFAVLGSVAGTVWFAADIVSQVRTNAYHIEKIEKKITEISKVLVLIPTKKLEKKGVKSPEKNGIYTNTK